VAAEPGSYRDPSGGIFLVDGHVYRTVMPVAIGNFEAVEASGALKPLLADGLLVPWQTAPRESMGEWADGASLVLEHPRLAFISYPYEWTFSALKDAALLHLDIHLRVLEQGLTLSDATAYNVQFAGPRPVFIDRLSFRPYRQGEIWAGHRQFCEQFLNPLLLTALCQVPYHAWYRGSVEGIRSADLDRMLPLRRKLSWNVLTHVVMQASFERAARKPAKDLAGTSITLPLPAFRRMLEGLRRWIARLEPSGTGQTVWRDYAEDNSYSSEQARQKRSLIVEFAGGVRPAMLWDIGCNTGDYAKAALEGGAGSVIGLDADLGALELAWARAKKEGLAFTPLYLDFANPSPSQGWAEAERGGLGRRARADALIALALVHHLAIGRNVPLRQVVHALVGLAPTGVIEFVPKSDPMVQDMLRFREDIFPDYTEAHFDTCLGEVARVVKSVPIAGGERKLLWYSR
jgi:ribosomal protein L11 methylase PrmA